MKDVLKIFALNMATFMKKYEYTQTTLAKQLGVSQQTVSKWCHGLSAPKMDMVDRICKLFNCNRTQLLEEIQSDETLAKAEYEKHLLAYFSRLNAEGMEKVLDYMKDLKEVYFE